MYSTLLSPYFTGETQVAHPPGLVKLTTADEAANATNETIEAEAQRGIQKYHIASIFRNYSTHGRRRWSGLGGRLGAL